MSQQPEFYGTLNPATGRPYRSCLKLTKYEHARILGTRAKNLSLGIHQPLVPVTESMDALDIAGLEIQQRLLPVLIRRHFPDGTYEDLPLALLEDARYGLNLTT